MLSDTKLKRSSRIGRLVIDKGWINQTQLEQALAHQAANQCRLGESLVALEMLTQRQLNKALCKQKWVRSFIAGMVMVTSPICPVLAGEDNETLQFVSQSGSQWKDNGGLDFDQDSIETQPDFSHHSKFELGISHQFSNSAGIEFGVATPSNAFTQDDDKNYVPQITFFTTGKKITPKPNTNFVKSKKHNRYKNTIPAVYRLTLKGYSIYETSDNKSKFLEFDKVKGSPYKKYELMFSVTKRF